MVRRLTLVLTIVACAVLSLSCKPATKPTTADDNTILALALTHRFEDGGYTVVRPKTGIRIAAMDDPEQIKQMKQRVMKELKIPGVDVGRLIDEFAAKNRQAVALSLPSAPERGYLIDSKGEYGKYFEKDAGGWERWYKEHPKAHGITTVSLPMWDKQSGVVLLYMETALHWLAGEAYLIAYKYDGTTLREIGRVILGIA